MSKTGHWILPFWMRRAIDLMAQKSVFIRGNLRSSKNKNSLADQNQTGFGKRHLPAYHPDTILRDWGNGDALRIGDVVTGISVTGQTGSGKTSSIARHAAFAFLSGGFGGLVLCAKPGECEHFSKWAAETEREDDLIIVNASGEKRYNFLNAEIERPGDGAGLTLNVTSMLDEIVGAVSGGNDARKGGDNRFWDDARRNLILNLTDLVVLAGLQLTLPLLRSVAASAPTSMEEVNDPAWQENSLCAKVIKEADEATLNADAETRADFEECRTYWTQDYPGLAPETRNSIILGFNITIRSFVTRPLRKLFSSDTNFTPEETCDGKIIIVDLPVQTFGLVGRITALSLKYMFQKMVLRRKPAEKGHYLRPVFLYADEAQFFCTPFDATYFSVCRSSGGATIYLTQTREAYLSALHSEHLVDSLLANLATKFWCRNTGPTNDWAARILGEHWVQKISTNVGQSRQPNTPGFDQGGQSSGVTRAEEKRFFVEPAAFTTLKCGGPAFGNQVEAIVFKAGHLFTNSNGTNPLPYRLLTFNQS